MNLEKFSVISTLWVVFYDYAVDSLVHNKKLNFSHWKNLQFSNSICLIKRIKV
jgi:hypothetical protein